MSRQWVAALALAMLIGRSAAAQVTAVSGDTLRVGGTLFRLDGVDAPELDQVCLNDKGAVWACGTAARDALASALDKHAVDCDDRGADPLLPSRRIGICWLDAADLSLNQRLVREGWAVGFESEGQPRFKADQNAAQDNRRGLWQGCFVAPVDLRHWNKSKAQLRGRSCRAVDNRKARDQLFPERPAMPPGCAIKGNNVIRAQVSGHRGVYHLESCRSYPRAKWPNRWFCSEEEAQAAGYRKSLTC